MALNRQRKGRNFEVYLASQKSNMSPNILFLKKLRTPKKLIAYLRDEKTTQSLIVLTFGRIG